MKQAIRFILFFSIFFTVSLSLKAQVDGLMFSMTYGGGANPTVPYGVTNEFDPLTNYDTAVVNFTGGANGGNGYGNFIQLKNGLLYGMTSQIEHGGTSTIFQYNIQTGQESVLYTATNPDSGQYMYGTLCHAPNDSLYGLAYGGGAIYGSGVLFSFNYNTGGYKILVQLRGLTTGADPPGSPILVNDSMLYCLTTFNHDWGAYAGTIFSYNIRTGDTAKCYTFTGGLDGGYPRGNLLQVNDSMLYGLTIYGGTSGDGILFSFNINTNTEAVLVNFTGPNGKFPQESLMQASDGNLYGTTVYGGVHDSGTLFQYNIGTNTETVLYSFNGSDTDGYFPFSDLIQASDGHLYGNTNGDVSGGVGPNNWGTIFSYDIFSSTKKTLYYYNNANGAYPYGDLVEVMSANVSVVNNSCPNDSAGVLTVNVRGDKPPLTYSWSTGATTSSISNLKSGIYTDTVWDSRGIEFVNIDTIKPLAIGMIFNVANACYDTSNGSASVTVTGGIPPFNYLWSNGASTDTASNLSVGTYTCTVTQVNGCPVMNNITITQSSPLVITSIVATETYLGNNGTVTVSVSGGTPPGDTACYLYVWSNGGPSDSSRITNLDSGYYSVCVTSCYDCGSVCSDSVKVLAGTKNINNPNFVKVYPVPSTGLITLNLTGSGFQSLEITDALGRPVYQEPLSSELKDNTLSIDLSAEPNGVYILYLTAQQGVLTRKIIIQK